MPYWDYNVIPSGFADTVRQRPHMFLGVAGSHATMTLLRGALSIPREPKALRIIIRKNGGLAPRGATFEFEANPPSAVPVQGASLPFFAQLCAQPFLAIDKPASVNLATVFNVTRGNGPLGFRVVQRVADELALLNALSESFEISTMSNATMSTAAFERGSLTGVSNEAWDGADGMRFRFVPDETLERGIGNPGVIMLAQLARDFAVSSRVPVVLVDETLEWSTRFTTDATSGAG